MKKILSIYYCWDEIGNPNSSQNRRQHSALKTMFDSTVVYRQFTDNKYGEDFLPIKSPNFLILDRVFLKIFQSLKLIWSLNIYFWGKKAYRAVCKQGNSYDIVLLTGTPYMLFSMAKKIARKFNAKLIIQMYDPLAMNNYVGGTSFFRKKMESKIIKEADLIIIHSKLMYELMCQKYSSDSYKIKFIPFSNDPDIQRIPDVTSSNSNLTIVHAGSLQNNRKIDLLIEAMNNLTDAVRSKITVQLIGNVSVDIKKQINTNELGQYFEIIPFVDKEALYQYYANADVLLVVDSFKDNINIFFPSKICEYLNFKKVIFLLTPVLSETRWVLNDALELCFGEDESDKLKLALENLVDNRRFYENKIDYSLIDQFLPQNTMTKFTNYIDDLFRHE